jgi:hypothetical protein
MVPQMGHNFKSIFKWQHEVYITENGEEHVDVQRPVFPRNPVSQLAKLTLKGVCFNNRSPFHNLIVQY